VSESTLADSGTFLDDLLAAEARLDRSFAIAVTAFVLSLGWPFFVRLTVLALLPIPLVSTIIQASPLSLKFILAAELRATIHERTFAD